VTAPKAGALAGTNKKALIEEAQARETRGTWSS
jgi:hypothetical protein